MILIALGRAGTGKTYLLKKILTQRLARTARLVVIDTVAEFPLPQDRFPLRVIPRDAGCFRLLLDLSDVDIFIDELDFHYARGGEYRRALTQLFMLARNRCVNIFATAKRFANIGRIFTYLANFLAVFQVCEGRDLDYFNAEFGIEARALTSLKRGQYIRINLGDGETGKANNDNVEIYV